MASLFPSHVRILKVGVSYEGRDIYALKIGVHPTNSQRPLGKRETIIVMGGSHAREWISVSTVNYVAYSLITSYGKAASVTNLLERFDWIFIPTSNPDGYSFTWESDRLWRKSRQPTSVSFCRGLDVDRSWGFEWRDESIASNPCSESFPGDEPFQSVESRSLAQWFKNETDKHRMNVVGFLDLHSYSQQVLYPYSYSCDASSPSLEDLEELALDLAKAIRSSGGETYGVSSACMGTTLSASDAKSNSSSTLGSGAGSALDWFHHEMRVRYAYQIKLRDTGSYGFLLPREEIVPTGEEVLAAVKYFGEFLTKGASKSAAKGNQGHSSTSHSTGPASYELRRRRKR